MVVEACLLLSCSSGIMVMSFTNQGRIRNDPEDSVRERMYADAAFFKSLRFGLSTLKDNPGFFELKQSL